MNFPNEMYRRHSCGCYRWTNVTQIDERGSDPCPKHAPRPLLVWSLPKQVGAAIVLWVFAFAILLWVAFDHFVVRRFRQGDR
jgi:hypothetical protein